MSLDKSLPSLFSDVVSRVKVSYDEDIGVNEGHDDFQTRAYLILYSTVSVFLLSLPMPGGFGARGKPHLQAVAKVGDIDIHNSIQLLWLVPCRLQCDVTQEHKRNASYCCFDWD